MNKQLITKTEEVQKNLSWLLFNIPYIKSASTNEDKMQNCIHLYIQDAHIQLEVLKNEISKR